MPVGAGGRARRTASSQGVDEEAGAQGGAVRRGTRRAPHRAAPADRDRGDREQQRPEGGRGHRAQQLGQCPLAAAQPARREQAHGDMRGQQQPGGRRVGVREQQREPVGVGTGHPGQRRADMGVAAAQHVPADRAQRTGERAARAAVADLLAGGEDGVGGQFQRDQQGGDPAEAALAARQGVGEDEHGARDGGHRVQRQRDLGQQDVRRGAERHDHSREQRRAHGSESGPGYVHSRRRVWHVRR
ncbi:hypothetical protein CF54_24625 [Streptomyces sp. Tu 6176]|nr:hypothetical protein CF54_24625 [Streptomyces sp. Tu 6176]